MKDNKKNSRSTCQQTCNPQNIDSPMSTHKDEYKNKNDKKSITKFFKLKIDGSSFDKFPPIKVSKALHNINYGKKLKNGQLLVKVESVEQEVTVKNFTEIDGKSVIAEEYELNSSQGIIIIFGNIKETKEELLNDLKEQGVTNIYTLNTDKLNQVRQVKINKLLLTFRATGAVPKKLIYGDQQIRVTKCYPKPMQCCNCGRIGHLDKWCREEEVCRTCYRYHDGPCSFPIKCVNCKLKHNSMDKTCPKLREVKEILKIKTDDKITFKEAVLKHKNKSNEESSPEAKLKPSCRSVGTQK